VNINENIPGEFVAIACDISTTVNDIIPTTALTVSKITLCYVIEFTVLQD
jgi:hypothetical protein